jgi:hypothetical protein
MILLSALAPSTMNSRQTFGSSPRSICRSAPARRQYSRCPFDQGERMFAAVCIDPEGGDQHHIVADVQAVDLDHQRSSSDRSDAIHSASRSADSATNRREAADFESGTFPLTFVNTI